ncbi:EpsG family protein [Empedobacter sp. R132-2]|uniref:EpsG family protein n=1 Tax=Empedobacter sp. R132-2 TaxID=2746740 RepID=UPI00257668A2|nr:EpsG family protein [Empedobacter sp. R132-2]MDM1139255.1 EpsG family protein [Empedobacter sp. R132-2]
MSDYILYHIIALLPIILYIFKVNDKLKKILTNIVVIIIGVFLCFGYMTGSDWMVYEAVYEDNSLHIFFEPGYVLLMNIAYFFKLDFFTFLILTKLFCYYVIVKIIKKHTGDQFLIAFSFFISMFGFYLLIDNPLRNLIAIVVFLLSIVFFEKKKFFYFFLCGALAVSFHKSALLIFLVMPLLNLSLKRYSRILLIVSIVLLVLGVSGLFISIFTLVSESIPFFNKFSDSYLSEENEYIIRSSLNMKSILFLLFFTFVIVVKKNKFKEDSDLLYKLFLMYAVLFIITIFVPIFERFTFYFFPFFVIIFIKSSKHLKPSNVLNFFAILILTIVFNTHTLIMNKVVYLPYSNYLNYIFENKPSYQYRINYNQKNSPANQKD